MNQNWIRTFSIIVGLSGCFVFFQNFSLDKDFHDIRTYAPVGTPTEPRSGYFPENLRSTSLSGLGNELLKYNFSDDLKHIENNLRDWSGLEVGRGPAAQSPSAATEAGGDGPRAPSYRLRTGHLGKDRFGLRYQSSFKVNCEYSALKNELLVSLDQPLGRNANLSLKHNTEDHTSSVNFNYDW